MRELTIFGLGTTNGSESGDLSMATVRRSLATHSYKICKKGSHLYV